LRAHIGGFGGADATKCDRVPFYRLGEKIPPLLESAAMRPLNFTGGVIALALHVCLNPGRSARVTLD